MFRGALGMSALIGFVLLNFRQHPVEFARCDFSLTVFADARDIHFQGSATVRAVKVSACCRRLSVAIAYESPVFAPAPQLLVRAAHDLASRVHSVIITFGPDSQGDRVIEGILSDLNGLNLRDAEIVERVSQALTFVSVNPVFLHLEDVVGSKGTRSLPL